ncbi:MAG: hypothetical protein K6B74_06415 [Ruminococcus sp.]|nr:hypothetical protein [Ruminococcus sp.]
MGKAWLKKFEHENSKWTDKDCRPHKHDFSEKVVIHLSGDENKHIGDLYYSADKCRLCRSFINARLVGNTNECKGLETYHFIKPHFAIGFKDITPVE